MIMEVMVMVTCGRAVPVVGLLVTWMMKKVGFLAASFVLCLILVVTTWMCSLCMFLILA